MIKPLWPAPTWVHSVVTTRQQLNLALHVQDSPSQVALNRLHLSQQLGLIKNPIWLHQTHSNQVLEIQENTPQGLAADGAWTQEGHLACAVLTADCLPLLLCDSKGSWVAAVHCGWRGIASGIIENTLQATQHISKGPILAWFGPAIGPQCFEVGEEVRATFIEHQRTAITACEATSRPHKWIANIYQLAKLRLQEMGVTQIYGGDRCTYTENNSFYSYRRNPNEPGRMATLIWLGL